MEESYKPAFDGKIKEIPYISVDNFEDYTKKVYFLSHAHSDHTIGLFDKENNDAFIRNEAKIYMSKETNIILQHKHWNYKKIKNTIKVLEVGIPHTISTSGQRLEVTLISVTHMIGAVMFLFKTEGKNILFTGDFIIETDKIQEISELHNDGEPLHIDVMYVDSTFDDIKFNDFPSWELCYREITDKIKEWSIDDNHRIALYHNNKGEEKPFKGETRRHRLGYEDLYKNIYKATNLKVFLDLSIERKMYRKLFGKDDVTDDTSSKIHVCFNKTPDMSHNLCGVSNIELGDKSISYLHISVSNRPNYVPDTPAIKKNNDSSMHLCYVAHCSKIQLDNFISHFSPKKIVKFPKQPFGTPKKAGTSNNRPPKTPSKDNNNVEIIRPRKPSYLQ